MNTNVCSPPLPSESSAVLEAIDRLERLILSHTGEDVFDEVLKLILAKLVDEEAPEPQSRFRPYASPSETARVLDLLFREAREKWTGVFPHGSAFRLPPEVLDGAVRELTRLRLRQTSLSILDAVLERLLTRSAKGAMGQYFTPRNVVSMAVEVLGPRDCEVVLDPACGSAGFLLTALNLSRSRGAALRRAVGFDFDVKAFRIAHIMASVAGGGRVTLSRRNSLDLDGSDLDDDGSFDQEFGTIGEFRADVILTNPPFGGDVTSPDVLRHYACASDGTGGRTVAKMPRELLFVERCVQLLKPGGRAAIVVPQGVVSNSSTKPFRDWLLSACSVLGVVGVHPFAFLPHTGVKTSVLFIERRTGERRDDPPVFFAVSKRPGKDSAGRYLTGDGNACYGNGDDLRAIASAFRRHLCSIGKMWSDAHPATANGATTAVVSACDVRSAGRMDAEYFDGDVLNAIAALGECGAVPLRHHVAARVQRWKRRPGATIEYIDISSVDARTGQLLANPMESAEAPTRASYCVAPGDVLVSTVRPARNSVGLVTESGHAELVATNGFCVLRPKDLSPELLFAFCKTQMFRNLVTRCATATMYPAVSDDDVLDVAIPPIPVGVASEVEDAIRLAHEQLASARRLIEGAVSKLDAHLDSVTTRVPPNPTSDQRRAARGPSPQA